MKQFNTILKVTDAAKDLAGKLLLINDIPLNNASELSDANDSSLCFFESEKYLPLLEGLIAGLVVVPTSFNQELLPNTNLFFADKPYLAFNRIVTRWLQLNNKNTASYIEPSATIGDNCQIEKTVTIKKNVIIGSNVVIGDNTVIEANSSIGDNVSIGSDCHIYPNTTIYEDTEIFNRVIIHSGCVIGADGFGYILNEGKQEKICQIGKVVIEDDVEIGANTCIDRSTIGVTRVGEGTKIDNLVQIGHNCKIGRHSIICAQVGLAGSTEVGDYVYLAGQVGAAGHLKIEDRALIGAQSGVAGNVPAGAKYFGTPAIDAGLQKRIIVSLKRLPEMLKHYNKIDKS